MEESRKLSGRDLITIGIFSAIYFVLNLAAMFTGFVPVLWLLLPGVTGIVTGIPFLLMTSKVRKPGAVLIMGTITALLYFVTGQFTVLLLITFAIACVLSGLLLLRTSSMQKMIAAMYTLHLPQGFIIAMSTTLRYFPALKEEFVHINAAMKLQNISWASRLECTVVPLIVSAVNTSDEIAAAAVARGIENPGKKTSEITLHMGISDWLIMILVTFGILIVVIAG